MRTWNAASLIKANPNKRVILNGWTDWIGTDAYNKVLSQNRANAVKNYLEKQGYPPPARMTAISRGKSYSMTTRPKKAVGAGRRTEISFD